MFDPYHKWLGIPKDQRPPTFYQLLGIAADEQDAEVIEEAAIRQTAHVRTYQLGPQGADCTRILNEIAQARTVLLHPGKRREYDATLPRKVAAKAGVPVAPALPATTQLTARPPAPAAVDPFADLDLAADKKEPAAFADRQLRERAVQSIGRAPSRSNQVKAWYLIAGLAVAVCLLVLPLLAIVVGFAFWPRAGNQGANSDKVVETKKLDKDGEKPNLDLAGVVDKAKTDKDKIKPSADRDKPKKDIDPPIKPVNLPAEGELSWDPQDHVHDLAITPDGECLLTAGIRAKLWSLKDGKLLKTLEIPPRASYTRGAAAITRDGKRAATVTANAPVVRLWDLQERKEVGTLVHENSEAVHCLVFLPDDKHILTGANDAVRLWDATAQKEVHKFEGHKHRINAVACSADGKRALSGCTGGEIKLWDLETRKELHSFKGKPGLSALAFTRDGRYGLSTTYAGGRGLVVWDLQEKKLHKSLEGETRGAHSLALAPDGRLAVTGSGDGILRVIDLQKFEEIKRVEGVGGDISGLAFTADGKRLVLVGRFGVKVWDRQKILPGGDLSWNPQDHVQGVAVTPDGERLLTAGGKAKLWSLKDGQLLKEFETPHRGGWVLGAAAITRDGKRAASVTMNAAVVQVWDLNEQKETGALVHRGAEGEGVHCLVFLPDDRHLLTGAYDGLRLWDSTENKEVFKLQGHKNRVNAVACSADGKRALSGCTGGEIKLWDLDNRKELHSFPGKPGVSGLAFTRDGRFALSTHNGLGGGLVVWDLQEKKVHKRLEGPGRSPDALAVAHDGRLAVTGSGDGILRVVDLEKFEEVKRIEGVGGDIAGLAFTPDGKRLILAGRFGVKVWDFQKMLLAERPKPTKLDGRARHFAGHKGHVNAVAFSPYGKRLVSGGDDKYARVWDIASGKEVQRFDKHTEGVTCLSFTADSSQVVSGGADNMAYLWDAQTGKVAQAIKKSGSGGYKSVGLTADGKTLVACGGGNVFWITNLETGQERQRFVCQGLVAGVAISPKGDVVVSAEEVGKLTAWQVEAKTQTVLRSTQEQRSSACPVAVAANGALALATTTTGKVELYDLAKGKLAHTFEGHRSAPRAVAFSADVSWAASCDFEGNVFLWELLNNKSSVAVSVVVNKVLAMAVSPDMRWLALAGMEGLHVVDLQAGK